MANRVPVSQLLQDKELSSENVKKKSREEWRKEKELEEARKAGTAPAAVDETGKDINPHIPQYIASAPWYYNTAGPTLKHQRPQETKQKSHSGIEESYKRGVDNSKVITKYRKGACENCGALTHKKKDCLERPRKRGAKYSNANIAADEYIQPNINSDYDGKRDRWAGYDPIMHKDIIDEFQKIEDAKQLLKAEKLTQDPNATDDEEDEDEDKYADDIDMPGTKVDSKQRITVRNLRIREDTAKYLRNLDPNSAFYDPKTRSMRDNPNPQTNPDETNFAGENFVRYSGDTQNHAQAQLFAWEAHDKGIDVHVLAEPTKLELLQKEYEKKKNEVKLDVKSSVLQKYGGEEHFKVPPKALLLAQTEEYIEYSRDGKIVRGQRKAIAKSKYDEDVYINNHTTVFGSFWKDFKWGYKCCHSFVKNSYCVGLDFQTNTNELIDTATNEEPFETKTKYKTSKHKQALSQSELNEIAMDNEKKRNELVNSLNQKKRKGTSSTTITEPSEEDMEKYYITKKRCEDPMHSMIK